MRRSFQFQAGQCPRWPTRCRPFRGRIVWSRWWGVKAKRQQFTPSFTPSSGMSPGEHAMCPQTALNVDGVNDYVDECDGTRNLSPSSHLRIPLHGRGATTSGRARQFTKRWHPERRSGKLTLSSVTDAAHTRDVVLARAVEAAFSRRS